mgnify:FL=1
MPIRGLQPILAATGLTLAYELLDNARQALSPAVTGSLVELTGGYFTLPDGVVGDPAGGFMKVTKSAGISIFTDVWQQYDPTPSDPPTAEENATAVKDVLIALCYSGRTGVNVNTLNGNAGQAIGQNGTSQNPVDNLADADVIAADSRIWADTFWISPGSAIQPAHGYTRHKFRGDTLLWDLDLNGQTYPECEFSFAVVSGTGINTDKRMRFISSILSPVNPTVLGNSIFESCVLAGTVELADGADHDYRDCFGKTDFSPTIDAGLPTETTVIGVTGYQGLLTLAGLNSNCTVVAEGEGFITIDASCQACQIKLSSNWNVTNSSEGRVTFEKIRTTGNLEEVAGVPVGNGVVSYQSS